MNHVLLLLVIELGAVALHAAARATLSAVRKEGRRQTDLVFTPELTITSCVIGLSSLGMYESVPNLISPGAQDGTFILMGTEVFAAALAVAFICHMWGATWTARLATSETAGQLVKVGKISLALLSFLRNLPGLLALTAVLSIMILGR